MITDQKLNDMLERSIEAGKTGRAIPPGKINQLESEYNQLIHSMMIIHKNITNVDDMREEIAIVAQCYNELAERFVK